MPFGSDRVLLYDVEPWSNLGFGVPAFGSDNTGTLNMPIADMVDEIGRIQLFVATHTDAMRWQPPSINSVQRIAKLLMRVQSILNGRMKKYSEQRLEAGHATPAQVVFKIHPAPYFSSDVLRNKWLREYNQLVMVVLSHMMQHSDNNLPLTITDQFAQETWQYFREIKVLMGSELLLIPKAELEADTFLFTDAHFAAYDPMKVIVNTEPLDTPGPIFELPTEDDLRPLLRGIPANQIEPLLKVFPLGTMPNSPTRTNNEPAAAGVIGEPAV